MEEFNEGDVVTTRLDDSPDMMVENTRLDGLVSCFWFDTSMVIHRDVFHYKALEMRDKYEPDVAR